MDVNADDRKEAQQEQHNRYSNTRLSSFLTPCSCSCWYYVYDKGWNESFLAPKLSRRHEEPLLCSQQTLQLLGCWCFRCAFTRAGIRRLRGRVAGRKIWRERYVVRIFSPPQRTVAHKYDNVRADHANLYFIQYEDNENCLSTSKHDAMRREQIFYSMCIVYSSSRWSSNTRTTGRLKSREWNTLSVE